MHRPRRPTAAQPAEDAEAVGRLAGARGWTVGAAESLTSGGVASTLGAAEGASDWFRGAIVAYSREVKHSLLGVPPGPVVSRVAALSMATGARGELGADIAVATTGAGGPSGQDGQEPGTVWVAVAWPNGVHAEVHHLPGGPADVVSGATALAVCLLRTVLEDPTGPEGADSWGDQPAPLVVEDVRD